MPLRIAYLNSQYPSLSHTFIEREIRGVRARAIEVHTFSVNPPRTQDTLGQRHAEEARNTFTLKSSLTALLLAQIPAFLRWPLGYLRALLLGQRLFPRGLKGRATSLGYLFEAAQLARELDRRGLRHIHVHMANNGAAVAMLACVLDPRLSYSMSIHGSAEFFDVHRLNLKAKCERAVFVRCISEFCRAQIMAWSDPSAWSRYHIVHCAVDPEVLRPSSIPRPADGALRLLTVGRFEPIKGYPVLLEAVARLVRQGVKLELEMVGSGRLEPLIREQVKRLQLESVATLAGALSAEDMPAAYERNDVLIVSSFMEGVPVVLMEAMAKGLLVISTQVGGVPELVANGRSGLVVTPGSSDALAEAIAELARRRDQLGGMRAAARETIVRDFNVEHQAQEMEQLFRRYVGQASAAPAAEPAASTPARTDESLSSARP